MNFLELPCDFRRIYDSPDHEGGMLIDLDVKLESLVYIDPVIIMGMALGLRQPLPLHERAGAGESLLLGKTIGSQAKTTPPSLDVTVLIPKGVKFGGTHTYASTDDLLWVIEMGVVYNFSIVLNDVICECPNCFTRTHKDFGDTKDTNYYKKIVCTECLLEKMYICIVKHAIPVFVILSL